jgi:hypothetical protein
MISDSYFSGLSAASGGAIHMTVGGGDLKVTTSTFYECRTGDANGFGGAIAKILSGFMKVDYCCFKKCESSRYGLAINIGTGNVAVSSHEAVIMQTHFAFCDGMGSDDSHGTIHHENGLVGAYDSLNFSQNTVSQNDKSGSAFEINSLWNPKGGTWNVLFCTFFGCLGFSVILSDTPSTEMPMPAVDHCNFCENRVSDSGSILYAFAYGVDVNDCYFGGSNQFSAKIIFLEKSEAEAEASHQFRMKNCIFAGEMPDPSFYAETTANAFDTAATSLVLTNPGINICPTFTPRSTPVHTPMRSCAPYTGWRDQEIVIST